MDCDAQLPPCKLGADNFQRKNVRIFTQDCESGWQTFRILTFS